MDDQKLEKLHNDLKRSADSRGGRGGLGKGANNSKRIQIEYNPVEETTSKPTASDPKHIYIKFVPASDSNGKSSLKDKESKSSENTQRNKKKIEFDSDNEEDDNVQTKKEPKAAKKTSENSAKDSSTRTYSIVKFENGEDLVSSLEKTQTAMNGVGALAKVSLKTLAGKKKKAKDCLLVSLKKELPDSEIEITITSNAEGEEVKTISGILRKAKVGKDGVMAAVSL